MTDQKGIEEAVKLLKEELTDKDIESIEIRAAAMPDDRQKGIILVWCNTYEAKKAIYEKYGEGENLLSREDLNGRAGDSGIGVCSLIEHNGVECKNCEVCKKRKAYVSTLFYPALFEGWEVRARKYPPFVRKSKTVDDDNVQGEGEDQEQSQEA